MENEKDTDAAPEDVTLALVLAEEQGDNEPVLEMLTDGDRVGVGRQSATVDAPMAAVVVPAGHGEHDEAPA